MNYEKRELLSKLIEELTVEDVKEILSDVYKSLHQEEGLQTRDYYQDDKEALRKSQIDCEYELLKSLQDAFNKGEPNSVEVKVEDLKDLVKHIEWCEEVDFKIDKVIISE